MLPADTRVIMGFQVVNGQIVFKPTFAPTCKQEGCKRLAEMFVMQGRATVGICHQHFAELTNKCRQEKVELKSILVDTSGEDLKLFSPLGNVPRPGDVGFTEIVKIRGETPEAFADPSVASILKNALLGYK
jgi:hypothetical protein